jgi:hypothetical protein
MAGNQGFPFGTVATRRVPRWLLSFLPILLGLISAAVLVSVSVAASADLHPGGFDKNCNLCHFTKAPLISASLQLFVPPSYSALWELRVIPVSFSSQLIILSGLCRAPPSINSFSA